MFRPHEIANHHINLQNDTAGIVYEIERDAQHLDLSIKASPYSDAIRATLLRGDGLGTLNFKDLFPDAYSVMRVEAAGSTLNQLQRNKDQLTRLLHHENHPKLQESIDVYLYMLEANRLSDKTNHTLTITPQEMLTIYSNCVNGCTESSNPFGFRMIQTPATSPRERAYHSLSTDEFAKLIQDLCIFINANTLTPVSQAAIVKFQIEALEPFSSNLDSFERLMVHHVFCRRRLLESIILPLNLFTTNYKEDYFELLRPYLTNKYNEDIGFLPHLEKLILYTTDSIKTLLEFILSLQDTFANLTKQWKGKLGRVDRDSALELLLYELSGIPILTISQASSLIDRSFSATRDALERLESAGVVREGVPIQRHKTFEAVDAILLHDEMYRKYAPKNRVSLHSMVAALLETV